jgi:hypothetical protein
LAVRVRLVAPRPTSSDKGVSRAFVSPSVRTVLESFGSNLPPTRIISAFGRAPDDRRKLTGPTMVATMFATRRFGQNERFFVVVDGARFQRNFIALGLASVFESTRHRITRKSDHIWTINAHPLTPTNTASDAPDEDALRLSTSTSGRASTTAYGCVPRA